MSAIDTFPATNEGLEEDEPPGEKTEPEHDQAEENVEELFFVRVTQLLSGSAPVC